MMGLYRTLRSFNQGYMLTVMWLLITAMVIAIFFMFVHPFGTILLFWLGLIVLGLAYLAGKLSIVMQRRMARRNLTAGRCPACGGTVAHAARGDVQWACPKCDLDFLPTGAESPREGEPA
ncbi:MAG: hypothetical protein JSV91_11090 [Phycisphaerales bacterium]|nr:MAG: hypothetical protein JSV91_11090 [Phycisphaerales bacterium]